MKSDTENDVIDVEVKKSYLFPKGAIDGKRPEFVAEEWFIRHSINIAHASRDAHEISSYINKIFVNGKQIYPKVK